MEALSVSCAVIPESESESESEDIMKTQAQAVSESGKLLSVIGNPGGFLGFISYFLFHSILKTGVS